MYQNSDKTVEAVREFDKHVMASGHQSLVKEAAKYAEELNITLQLDTLNPMCVTTEGKVVTAARAGNLLKQSQEKQFLEIAKDKKWQGKWAFLLLRLYCIHLPRLGAIHGRC